MAAARWYFETWSPQDGIAFAVKRHHSAPGVAQPEPSLLAVALEPPHWSPVEVSPATARRAERGSFQVGFFDTVGQEIGFDSLNELIEVVRQAYVGSGGGPSNEEDAPLRPPMPQPEGAARPEDVLQNLDQPWSVVRQALLGPKGQGQDEEFGRLVCKELGAPLAKVFGVFAQRTWVRPHYQGPLTEDASDWILRPATNGRSGDARVGMATWPAGHPCPARASIPHRVPGAAE